MSKFQKYQLFFAFIGVGFTVYYVFIVASKLEKRVEKLENS